MKILDNVNISGSMNLSSNSKDQFIIGTLLENNDQNIDNLTVHANADFRNNVIIGSSSADTLIINATISGNLGNITASNLYVTGGTIYYNGMDLLSSMGGNNNTGNQQSGSNDKTNASSSYIQNIYAGTDIITQTISGSSVIISYNTASQYNYAFLRNANNYVPQESEKTIYFSFEPHYNNITYFVYEAQYQNLKSAGYAVSDISMSISLPPIQTHLGRSFTFINATYVGTSSNDTVGYSSSQGGLYTTSGKYSVHKISFYPYTSGTYTDYIGTGKLTGVNSFETYLITNAITDCYSLVGDTNETSQHNFITLQAVSSSQFGYTWMIRDVNDYKPFSLMAI
jgi:hypothetical protein